VAGTTGAGDAAYAGFLTALLHGYAPAEAMRWACAVGAYSVEGVDSHSYVVPWSDVGARMASGWALRPERVPGF
ncbi:MAG: carbohydrate kinase family protein, partial [Armatimonadetes bacterium]|nr:carbohydrate kinase family protein [Anaerolineae bacterium]